MIGNDGEFVDTGEYLGEFAMVFTAEFRFFPSRVDGPIRQKTKACFDSAEGGGGRTKAAV